MKILKLLLALGLACVPVYAQSPTSVVVTDANGKALAVTGVASAVQVGSPIPVVITDVNGKVIALGGSAGITFVAANPATCTPGTTGVVELNVAPYTVSYCSATNTWTAIGAGGGGSGTVTSIATTGPITGGTITATGTIACATCTTSAAALTANQVVLGAGSQAEAVLAAPTPPTSIKDFLCNDGTTSSYCVPGTPIDARTTTTETITSSDRGGIVTFSNASATALTLPAPTSNFGNNFNFGGCNINTGLVTMTPTASTFNGAATGLVPNHWCTYPYSDNSNYRGGTFPSIEAFPDCHSTGNALGFTSATGAFNCFTGYAPLAAPVFSTSISTPVVLTATKCAAVGSAASPSLVACSAAPAGSFSCATNASTATCVISSTIVTANSAVFVQPSAAAGTLLSVTCNTTADTGLTAPRLASISAGASFTINLGTFSTNPVCFNYWIVN